MEKKLVKTQPKEWSQNMEYHIRESDVDALWPSLTFFKKMKKQNKKKNNSFAETKGVTASLEGCIASVKHTHLL